MFTTKELGEWPTVNLQNRSSIVESFKNGTRATVFCTQVGNNSEILLQVAPVPFPISQVKCPSSLQGNGESCHPNHNQGQTLLKRHPLPIPQTLQSQNIPEAPRMETFSQNLFGRIDAPALILNQGISAPSLGHGTKWTR